MWTSAASVNSHVDEEKENMKNQTVPGLGRLDESLKFYIPSSDDELLYIVS